MKHVLIRGRSLEYLRLPSSHPNPEAPAMVFLHEGLGSVSLWRDFPQRVADATGCEAVLYSRYGYGGSTPLAEPRTARYMHEEALETLPEFLDALGLERPMLFGHSDGGSIALIHGGGSHRAVSGLIVMAPHVFVEEVALAGIKATGRMLEPSGLKQKLARHHREVDSSFSGWHDTWLSPEFRAWNIESYLPAIACPVLAIQGEDDEYGTLEQLERIAAGARDVERCHLADCRHSPQRDQPEAVIEAVTGFVRRLLDGPQR